MEITEAAHSCAHCPNAATAVWGTGFMRPEYVCAAHWPACLTNPSLPLPPGLWMRSVTSAWIVPHTTGHLGIAQSYWASP